MRDPAGYTCRGRGPADFGMKGDALNPFLDAIRRDGRSQFADACGALSKRVEHPADLVDAIRMAYDAHRPCLLDVQVNPDELLMPPKIQPGHAWGFSLAKLKEIFVEEELH